MDRIIMFFPYTIGICLSASLLGHIRKLSNADKNNDHNNDNTSHCWNMFRYRIGDDK
jgi:hypothetical protein